MIHTSCGGAPPRSKNTGAKLDETLGKRSIAFKDPDRIAWELYMT